MLAAVLLRVAAALYLGNAVEALPGISDQVSYHRLALRVAGGHGFSFDTYWWPLTRPGQPTAHWSYLYTLFLAGLYALGAPPLAPRLAQAVAAGLLMPWLAFRLGRRIFSERAGLIAAAWTAAYGYFVYYSAALMTEAFYFISILWTLDAALRLGRPGLTATLRAGRPRCASARPSAAGIACGDHSPYRLWAELGLAIAVTAYLRQVFLVGTPLLFIWLAAGMARRSRGQAGAGWRGWLRGAALSGGLALLLILPATAYNYARFGRFVLLNTNAGYAFFWANHPIYGPAAFVPILGPDMPTYQDLIPAELRPLDEAALESALLQRGLQFVVADPARWLRLSLSRVPVYFQFWPSAESSGLSNLVRVASFGLALPFMLLGIALWAWTAFARGAPGRRAGGLLLLFAAGYSLIHLLSWSLIRYRLPVDAVLLVFAGHGLACLPPGPWPLRHATRRLSATLGAGWRVGQGPRP